MKPKLYKACLNFLAERDQLKKSEWEPVMVNDLITIEKELRADLPKQYEDFLLEAGVGMELGGLAEWYHLDLSVDNNLIEANINIRKDNDLDPPKDFLAVYDLKDGVYFGFEKVTDYYSPELMVWDSEDGSYEIESDCLFEFLSENVDCTKAELKIVEDILEDELSQQISRARADLLPKFV